MGLYVETKNTADGGMRPRAGARRPASFQEIRDT